MPASMRIAQEASDFLSGKIDTCSDEALMFLNHRREVQRDYYKRIKAKMDELNDKISNGTATMVEIKEVYKYCDDQLNNLRRNCRVKLAKT